MREECPVCGELFYHIEGVHPYLDDTTLCCTDTPRRNRVRLLGM